MTTNQQNTEGWEILQQGIAKLTKALEEQREPHFTSEEYAKLYTTIYIMSCQMPPHDYSQQLYDMYRGVFVNYITSTVLPRLRQTHGENMLRELVKRWQNHKVMVHWLSRIFQYLDRYFIHRRSLPTLNVVAMTCFRDLVFEEGVNGKVRDAVKANLIDQEREGGQKDRGLLKNVSDILVELGMGQQMDDCKREAMEDSFKNLEVKDTSSALEDSVMYLEDSM